MAGFAAVGAVGAVASRAGLDAALAATLTAALALGVHVVAGWPMRREGRRVARALAGAAHFAGSWRQEAAADIAQRLSQDLQRLRAGVEACASMVLLADETGRIFYAHPRLVTLFTQYQDRFAPQFPDVAFPDVVGSPMAAFTAGVKTLSTNGAGEDDGSAEALVVAGGRMLRVFVAPILDGEGRAIGALARWDDATNDFEIENEVNNMVEMIAIGELDMQMAVPDGAHTYAKVATAINTLVETLKGTLDEINGMLAGLSRGDLSRKIENDFMGVFGELAQNANGTLDKVEKTVRDIRIATTGVNAALSLINEDTHHLSQRADEAAMILAETASDAAVLAETFKTTCVQARDAEQLAHGASAAADRCDSVAAASSQAMTAIQRSAARVNEIASVIDEIAFQTNMLALNAAVEAARAGAEGRGFAVVAQEVRLLSQRVARSAADIKDLLRESDAEIERGVSLARDSAQSLTVIKRDVAKVVSLIEAISGSSTRQEHEMRNMDESLSRLSDITQENSTVAGSTARAIDQLAMLAASLSEAVAFFGGVRAASGDETALIGGPAAPALIDGHNPFDDGGEPTDETAASLDAFAEDAAADEGPITSPSWATDGVTSA